MKPAFSVIFFTVSTGAGYGVFFVTSVFVLFKLMPKSMYFSGSLFIMAIALITFGLFSSVLHLGRPERAWMALSQWRSSWLSREGVFAIIAYLPIFAFSFVWIFLQNTEFVYLSKLLASLNIVFCLITVICTGMIYYSLKPIQRWRHTLVVPIYILHSWSSGLILTLSTLAVTFQDTYLCVFFFLIVNFFTWMLKLKYWYDIEREGRPTNKNTALGLSNTKKINNFDPPHTSENYLQKEMVFVLARKHSKKLRLFVNLFAYFFPLVLVIFGYLFGNSYSIITYFIAVILLFIGLIIERWLFFAEAKHTVSLYYI